MLLPTFLRLTNSPQKRKCVCAQTYKSCKTWDSRLRLQKTRISRQIHNKKRPAQCTTMHASYAPPYINWSPALHPSLDGSMAILHLTSSNVLVPGLTRPARDNEIYGIEEASMDLLWTLAIILLILWLLGLVTSYTLGGFIHILLVLAIVVVLIRVIQGRRPV